MPLILQFSFADGTTELIKVPAEIWRKDDKNVSKVFIFKKEVTGVVLDPYEFSITFLSFPSITATHEFVVPRSMPIILPVFLSEKLFNCLKILIMFNFNIYKL